MLLAVTGARSTEALSIRLKDLDLESNPAKLGIRGEFYVHIQLISKNQNMTNPIQLLEIGQTNAIQNQEYV